MTKNNAKTEICPTELMFHVSAIMEPMRIYLDTLPDKHDDVAIIGQALLAQQLEQLARCVEALERDIGVIVCEVKAGTDYMLKCRIE